VVESTLIARALLLISLVASLWASPVFADRSGLLHSQRSLYREVLVYQNGSQRCMCFTRDCKVGRQSCMDTRQPDRFVLNYTRMMLAALFVTPQPKSVLVIGLGGGTLPRALSRVLPDALIDTVEIDPAVTKVAQAYFDFKTSARLRVAEIDGRVFVKRALREGRRYDLIMLDAFDHEYIPEHLLTEEFLREVKTLLRPGGVVVANTFSSSRLYDHESVTYQKVFGPFFNLKRENRVIIAGTGALPDTQTLAINAKRHEAALAKFAVDADGLLKLFRQDVDWNPKARVLTDQYSPANLLNLD
jgi:spermidine synthase